jgi:hypothetical protein
MYLKWIHVLEPDNQTVCISECTVLGLHCCPFACHSLRECLKFEDKSRKSKVVTSAPHLAVHRSWELIFEMQGIYGTPYKHQELETTYWYPAAFQCNGQHTIEGRRGSKRPSLWPYLLHLAAKLWSMPGQMTTKDHDTAQLCLYHSNQSHFITVLYKLLHCHFDTGGRGSKVLWNICNFSSASPIGPMFSGSLVTMAWHILGLRVDKMTSRYTVYLWIYWISSHGQLTGGGPPGWGFCRGAN